jgi:two-component system KDP operon response regulator KdpE
MARMRVTLRRTTQPMFSSIFQVDALTIDLGRRRVTIEENEISLTPTEYNILRTLAQNAGKVVTHRQLLRQVWGANYESEMHILRVNISNLRRKIETNPNRPNYILTEPGVGYRLKSDI